MRRCAAQSALNCWRLLRRWVRQRVARDEIMCPLLITLILFVRTFPSLRLRAVRQSPLLGLNLGLTFGSRNIRPNDAPSNATHRTSSCDYRLTKARFSTPHYLYCVRSKCGRQEGALLLFLFFDARAMRRVTANGNFGAARRRPFRSVVYLMISNHKSGQECSVFRRRNICRPQWGSSGQLEHQRTNRGFEAMFH